MSITLRFSFFFFFHESRWDIFFLLCASFLFCFTESRSIPIRFVLFYSIHFHSVLFHLSSNKRSQNCKPLRHTWTAWMRQKTSTSKLIVANQLTAEERNFLQGSLQPVGATVEQLTAEEKTIHQKTKEATECATIQEEDSNQAAEEGSTQENVLNQKKKKTEVSCVKSKLKAILLGKGNFIFLAYIWISETSA